MIRLVMTWPALAVAIAASLPAADKPIRNYSAWTDTAGNPISCHDGGITRVGDTFYWYGTSYQGNPQGLWGRRAAHLPQRFNCYRSKNLVDWKYEGVCFQVPKDGWLAKGTSHRPNVLYNDKAGRYVLWFFCIGTTEPGGQDAERRAVGPMETVTGSLAEADSQQPQGATCETVLPVRTDMYPVRHRPICPGRSARQAQRDHRAGR